MIQHIFNTNSETLVGVDDIAYHWAIYRLCRGWHSGQWSKGYRLLCIAMARYERDYATPRFPTLYSIEEFYARQYTTTRGSFTRKRMAFYLRKLMKFRKSL